MRNHRGLLITIEKTREGLGGTTLCSNLAEALRSKGFEVVLTREPGGTGLGQKIREMMLDPKNKLSKATELFLQLADRAQHYKEVLKPSLRDGKIIISDRYFDSTLMYQGAGRGWKTALLWRLHHATTGSLLPNLTFVLDGTPFRATGTDRFESESQEFLGRVEQFMRYQATRDARFALLEVDGDESFMLQKALQVIEERKLTELVELPNL